MGRGNVEFVRSGFAGSIGSSSAGSAKETETFWCSERASICASAVYVARSASVGGSNRPRGHSRREITELSSAE